MNYIELKYEKGNVILFFNYREPVILWNRDEVMRLTIDLCNVINKAFPENKKKS